jgi:hypothetical protein
MAIKTPKNLISGEVEISCDGSGELAELNGTIAFDIRPAFRLLSDFLTKPKGAD